MLYHTEGDIFKSNCEAICNPVNCIGIMGGGLALVFKNKYPEMFKEYKKLCDQQNLNIGNLHFWRNPSNNPKWIINFPTKTDLSDSKIEYIQQGLIKLRESIINKKIKSVAIPALGCGLGNLNFETIKKEVESIMLDYIDEVKILDECEIKLYKPLE